MTFSYKNTSVYYTSKGIGRAIVLLHGFLENSSMWNIISEELSKKHHVICIDLLGHGKTENHGYIHTMKEQAEMVVAVLKHLRLRKYIVVGHSMGGYIALEFVKLVSKNIKGLCLMNSTALPDSEEKKINRDRAITAVKQNHKTFIRIAIPMLFSEENRTVFTTEIKEITNEALKMSPQGIIAALEGMKIRKNKASIYKNADFPILMIIGKQDPALDYNSLIAQTKNTKVEVVEFPDGHMSHIENKDALTTSLISFAKHCN
ncbi:MULTISPECIES: alpha/beta fold hydrolase [Flavobacteriaceae]|uniref:Alpha/beta hydrolase n=2 Tax=Flavobacteriaceae TaxID=49546 RepID=A0A4Y8APM6_9FLAO|nr:MULTISPECIES: alpha/beta hydrolase [Flavobacteriaceae]TEW72565.1 alpha/beta hydrolase [Gramella jeungdoensis]GGK54667.1 alpha/beta hydrolase [Lutibacter litoralis]